MICKRIQPCALVSQFVKEYVLLHMQFNPQAATPVKTYPVNPESGITLLIRGQLRAESPALNLSENKYPAYVFGQPNSRQNFHLTHEFMLVHIRFHAGGLFRLLKIPMQELLHTSIDAELIFGKEITSLTNQLANTNAYAAIPTVLDAWLYKKINRLKNTEQPVDRIGRLIAANPQDFNLVKAAREACLSIRQFEKRFTQQIGITPKYFARICRFYQAYGLKEAKPGLDWLSIAVQTGYNDYQHLVKDFKQFAGVTPNVLISEAAQNPERILNIAPEFTGV